MLKVIAGGVDHEYTGNERAAVELARSLAEADPGAPVQLVGVADDGTAINAELRWTPEGGIEFVDNLAVVL